MVTGVTLSGGVGEIGVSWSVDDMGSDLTQQAVRWRVGTGTECGVTGWTRVNLAGGADPTYMIDGESLGGSLDPGSSYQVGVGVRNRHGPSEWVCESATLAEPPPTTSPGDTGTTTAVTQQTTGQVAPPLRDYFTDDAGSVHEVNINLIARRGITVGCDPERPVFCPDGDVTRAQMAVFLVRAMGATPTVTGTGGFSDVASDAWYAGFVARLARSGVTAGFDDGTFGPDETVTRAQMATFLVRTVERLSLGNPSALQFSDVSADQPHAAAIAGLVEAGVARGFADLTYRPDDPATRAQMATFLAIALDLAS